MVNRNKQQMNFNDVMRAMGCEFIAMDSMSCESYFSSSRACYMGVDPTAISLHVGNMPGLFLTMMASLFGHDVYFLVGGGTALIGDPSGKKDVRTKAFVDDVSRSAQNIELQIRRLQTGFYEYVNRRLSIDPKNYGRCVVVNNADWLSKISLIHFLRDFGFTSNLNVMLSKEFVKSRLQSGLGLSYAEFSYQLLQGLDFAYLYHKYNVDVQIGGRDQIGNMISGFDLYKSTSKTGCLGSYNPVSPNLGVLTFDLLVDADGKKFGKTEGNALWLDKDLTSPYELFQAIVKVEDVIIDAFINKLSLLWWTDSSLPTIQKAYKLAGDIVEIVHGIEVRNCVEKAVDILKPGRCEKIKADDLDTLSNILPANLVYNIPKNKLLKLKILDLIEETVPSMSKTYVRNVCKNDGLFINDRKIVSVSDNVLEEDIIGKYMVISIGKNNKFLLAIGSNFN